MKKILSVFLALVMLCTVFAVPVFSDDKMPTTIWDNSKKVFKLKDGPEIVRLAADTTEYGTKVTVYFRHTDDFAAIGEQYHKAFDDVDLLFANAIGMSEEHVDGNLAVGVQLAYSFDKVNWVNDFDLDMYDENLDYSINDRFDLDDPKDEFFEYCSLPNYDCSLDKLFVSADVFDGRAGHLTSGHCDPADGMSIKEALTIRNNTLLQGRGEFTGSEYENDDENFWHGFRVDFNQHTLYVKARYRVYSSLNTSNEDDEWGETERTVVWSDWSSIKTYNNETSSFEDQSCVPDVAVLNSAVAPTLKVLSFRRENFIRDEVEMKRTYFQFYVSYPDNLKKELSKYFAVDDYDSQIIYTGEGFSPMLIYEIKVGNGDWYFLNTWGYNDTFYHFCDDEDWLRHEIEALGYKPGDPVYLRVRLYGPWSYRTDRDDAVGYDKVSDSDTVYIKSAVSNIVELNMTGKFRIDYDLDGGSFPYGTTQIYLFDEETLVNVDLTSADYTPERKHFVFNGWYTTENFAAGTEIQSFNTAEKASRVYYAKWTELKSYKLDFDLGVITDYVYNPNPDKIYEDDGSVDIEDISYAGAKFLGWYTSKEGGTKISSLSYEGMKKDTVLYAHWELPEKTIAYSGAGKDYTNNKDNPATYQINPKGDNTVVILAPEKKGYIFDGWYLDKDYKSGKLDYDNEKGGWLLNESENVTLYAKWILGRWNITYVLNHEGVWNGANPENYTYGTAVTLNDPSLTGYTFNGWYADSGFKTKVTQIKADDTGEKTLYANWTAIQYSIKYDLRDPNIEKCFRNDNPTSRTVDDEVVLKPLVPTSKMYKFLGWYESVNFDGKPFEKIGKGTAKNITVFGHCIKYSWGDVDFDGKVTAYDARLVLRCAVGLEELEADALAWADVDTPSKEHILTAADARYVLRLTVGLETVESLNLPEMPIGF